MEYVVKMDGMKVRSFSGISLERVSKWAVEHCHHGKIEIIGLSECKELPRACGRMYPNEDMKKLVYKPFGALA